MLNDLLGIFLKVLLGFFENLVISPIFNFFDAALFGSKDPLA